MTKRRVCCLCESWESGGIEAFLSSVLLHMDLDRIEVDVVAAQVKESVFTDRLEEHGVHFVQLSGKLRDYPLNVRNFRALIRRRRYDVVHFNLFQGLSLCYVEAARQEGVEKRIVHAHGGGLRKSPTRWLKLLIHRMGRAVWKDAATEYWACSRKAGSFLFGDVQARIIPDVIDVESFRFSPERRMAMRQRLGLEDQLLVGTVGRLSEEKNHAFLIDVFRQLHRKEPNSRLLLVGDGPCMADLRARAENAGVDHAVIFAGMSREVSDWLSAMDVFVFPSFFEGLGIAAVEAQASGLPVVMSDGIPPETRLTDEVYTLRLLEGGETWAACVLACADKAASREKGADRVRAAGFDIPDGARLVEQSYQ